MTLLLCVFDLFANFVPLYFLFLNVGSDKGLEGLTKLRSLKDLLSDRKKNISHSLYYQELRADC